MVVLLILVIGCGESPALEPATTSPIEPPEELLEEVPFAVPKDGPTEAWQEARRLFFSAYLLQLEGKLEEATEQYQRSINVFPTAEAYTFLGWAYSYLGRYDDAIQEAQHAIAVDPEYGNPYNDVGTYLMEQGKLDEAIPWFMQATQAKRYASPHYPWLNLGHVWILKGEWGKALTSYEEIWNVAPEYPIPTVPTLEATPFLPSEQARDPGTKADQHAVKEAITQYFQARNNYNAEVLKEYSDPLSTEACIAFLLHLAAAKRGGVTITVYDTRVLHLEDSIAIVEISISASDETAVIWYLLRQTNGSWKVVVCLRPATLAPTQ